MRGGENGSKERGASRADQRRRLLDAAVALVASVDYPDAKVGDLARRAGVSRATFYELFPDKEACFLVAHDELAAELAARVETRLSGAAVKDRSTALVDGIVDYARVEPAAFNFLTHEAGLAGPAALTRRDRLVASLADQLDAPSRGKRRRLDPLLVPGWVLVGGVLRLLGMRMRRGEAVSPQVAAELVDWIERYRVGGRSGAPDPVVPGPRIDLSDHRAGRAAAPQPLPRGRHRLPRDVVRRVQRDRMLHATARVISSKGYPNTTVADIVASAGVSREVFYSHFSSRSEAYLQTHQLVFEQLMATTAGAFFATAGPWPEQVWQGAQASTRFALEAPSFAYFAFVESYALGSSIATRTDEAVVAFTVLLEKGYSMRPEAEAPPPSTSEAIVASTMEAVALYLRERRREELMQLLPMTTFLVIAPFIGSQKAGAFVKEKLGGVHPHSCQD